MSQEFVDRADELGYMGTNSWVLSRTIKDTSVTHEVLAVHKAWCNSSAGLGIVTHDDGLVFLHSYNFVNVETDEVVSYVDYTCDDGEEESEIIAGPFPSQEAALVAAMVIGRHTNDD